MGYRYLTEKEFDYIKELIKKYKRLKKVTEIANRSYSVINYIKKATTFEEYCKIRPNSKSPKKRKIKEIKPPKDYSGALLAEMKRLRKSNDNLKKVILSLIKILQGPDQRSLFESTAEKPKNKPKKK